MAYGRIGEGRVELLATVCLGCTLVFLCAFPSWRTESRIEALEKKALRRGAKQLANLYSLSCSCQGQDPCPCAEAAASNVSAALDNAVAREFASPGLYYRSKNGYRFKVRGFMPPVKTVRVAQKAPAPASIDARYLQKKVASRKKLYGLKPLRVPATFVRPGIDPETYRRAHPFGVTTISAKARQAALGQRLSRRIGARTTSLLGVEQLAENEDGTSIPLTGDDGIKYGPEVSYAAMPDKDQLLDSQWFQDWLPYAKMVLTPDGQAAAYQESQIPKEPREAFKMEPQLGAETDTADWDWAHGDMAVKPYRINSVGESNFPEFDANINSRDAVISAFNQPGTDDESYAAFLAQKNSDTPDPSSVEGWLMDDEAY